MIAIVPYATFAAVDRSRQIDAIFYEASAVRSFTNSAERAAFHWRWLGRYLAEEPEHSFVAVLPQNRVAGYITGSIADPARRPEFNELGYFRAFANLTARYPAHFHINVAGDLRSAGVGTELISAFAFHAAGLGAAGMHVVTGKGLRNVGFYMRNGFTELANTIQGSRQVILLGRKLEGGESG